MAKNKSKSSKELLSELEEKAQNQKYGKGSTDENVFLNELFEAITIANRFEYNIKKALIANSKDQFNAVYEERTSYLKNDTEDGKPLSGREIRIRLVKSIASAVLEFTDSPAFKEDKTEDYLKVFDEKFSPKFFSFLLWTKDKKEGCFNILKTYSFDFTPEEYDLIYEELRVDKHVKDLPWNSEQRKEFLAQQRDEYLFHQSRYKLMHDLSNMPTQEEQPAKSKKAKI